MANGKLKIVATTEAPVMTEEETLAAFETLGAEYGAGAAAWEKLAYGVIGAVERNQWSADCFNDKAVKDKKAKDAAAAILNRFYNGAAGNKKIVRPTQDSDTFVNRVANVRSIAKATFKHDMAFRTQLQGTNSLIDTHLVKAIESKPPKGEKKRTIWGAFEAICRASVILNDKDHPAGTKLTKDEIDHCVWHKPAAKKDETVAFVDAVAAMIERLAKATQGYKDKDENKVPAIFTDKELIDAHKSLKIWHDKNAAKGSPKRGNKNKEVNFLEMTPEQFAVMQARMKAAEKEFKKAAAATA